MVSDAPNAPFHSVVCGIDGSSEGLESMRQAALLAAPEAKLWAISAWDPGVAMMAGIHASEVMIDLRRQMAEALQAAVAETPRVEPVLMRGGDVASLLAAVANLNADLIAVGAHGHSRAAGVVFGSVATALSRHATCSTLVARPLGDRSYPGRIMHANDGSPEATDAARVAGQIAAMHGATVVSLHVTDDENADHGHGVAEATVVLTEAAGREPAIKVVQGSPHHRIVESANESDASLIVLGSRGKTGLRALGSVAERVAHNASCSVLIVRRAAHPSREDDGVPSNPVADRQPGEHT